VSTKVIVSYDGTPNDDDALALGRLFARAGATLALAYVRHAREYDPGREELAQHDAERRLEQGAQWLGDPSIPRHVVISPSTGEGLARLAEAEGAEVIAFGSDYRTPPGRVEPGTTAQGLLDGGPVAVAIANAGLRTYPDAPVRKVAVHPDTQDPAATETAQALAAKLGASVAHPDDDGVDLLVLGSQAGAPVGRVRLSGAARHMLDRARCPVLILARGKPVLFDGA
jgi:nucleotide-binding universal stress UspA family protein